MTLTFAGVLDRTTVLSATEQVFALISRPEVELCWGQESSCAGMSVGGLTRHLAGQAVNALALPGTPPPKGVKPETLSLLEHYARAPWLGEDLDGETNRAIREIADQQAAEGPVATQRLVTASLAELPDALADLPDTTYIPWQGWSLRSDDFLVVRMLEMVVHSDDLAASIGVPTPGFDSDVLDPVLRLLTAIAVSRHGQDAVVRTLSRPQRAPGSVSAF